jgi:hypothetical protein
MNRASSYFTALVAALLSLSADAATVYRCHTARGVTYQDVPCRGRDSTQNRVSVGEPSVITSNRHDSRETLGEWADQVGQENRKRELLARAQRLQRENQAETAEFAAMVEQLNEQKNASAQGVANVPSVPELEQQQYQAQRDYRSRMDQRSAQMSEVQAELGQYQQQ